MLILPDSLRAQIRAEARAAWPFECCGLLEGVRDERAFLLRVAHNLAIDLIRRRGTREKHCAQLAGEPAPIFAPASEPDESAFREALGAALREIPADQRAVVHLKLWEGLTFEQIAELLGIPDEFSQVGMFPIAYTTGTDFKPAPRLPLEPVLHWDEW